MKTLSTIILILFGYILPGQQVKEVRTYYDLGRTKVKETYSVLIDQPNTKHGLYRKYDQRGLKALEIPFTKGVVNGVAKEFYLPQIGKAGDERLKTETPYTKDQKNGIAKTYVYILNGKENIFSGAQFLALEQHYNDDIQIREIKYYTTGKKEYDSYLINGLTTKWYENGSKKEEYESLDSQIYGQYTYWYENGQIGKTGLTVKGKEHGEWTHFLESGEAELIEYYDNGFLEKEKLYYESGSYSIAEFTRKQDYHTFILYHPDGKMNYGGEVLNEKKLDGSPTYHGNFWKCGKNGSIILRGIFKKGKKDGEWKTYDENGMLTKTEVFENGYLIDEKK